MSITALSVFADKEEYCSYEAGQKDITAVVYPTPALTVAGESITIKIMKARRSRDEEVYSETYEFTGATESNGIEFTWDINDIVDSDDIPLMRRGNYYVAVEDDNGVVADAVSDDFRLALCSVNYMRNHWLFGVPLTSFEIRSLKVQPQRITGVVAKDISRGHPMVMAPLKYMVVGTKKFLCWAEGPQVEITAVSPTGAKQTIVTPGPAGQEYIVFEINPRILPASSVEEFLIVESDLLSDENVRQEIDSASDLVERSILHTFVEPTMCVSDRDPSTIVASGGIETFTSTVNDDYDEITQACTFYPTNPGRWINVQLPFTQVLTVENLFGAIANTRVIDVNLEWVEIDHQQGFLQLVPFNQEVAFNYLGLVWAQSVRGAIDLPNFWHYRVKAGLRKPSQDILAWVGKTAAIPLLAIAGQAYRAGYASQSTSRDGISESVSYTSSAMFGVYSATIEEYRKWLEMYTPKISGKYRGLVLVVL